MGDTFTITENHFKLLRRMYVGWQNCETGAPEIDPKRPYGNSDVENDVAEIIGDKVDRCPHCDELLSDDISDKMMALHRETETALEIVLCFAGEACLPGRYRRKPGYCLGWEKVDD